MKARITKEDLQGCRVYQLNENDDIIRSFYNSYDSLNEAFNENFNEFDSYRYCVITNNDTGFYGKWAVKTSKRSVASFRRID